MKLKEIGSTILGIVCFAGLIILVFGIIKGIPWVSAKIYPIVTVIYSIGFLISLISIPFAFIPRARFFIGSLIFGCSYISGLYLWVFSSIVAYTLWGLLGLIVGLIITGVGVVPVALLASLFKGDWTSFGNVVLGLVITFGFRMLGIFIASKQKEKQIISDADSSYY